MADNTTASRAFLLVSIILGVLATVLAFAYLNGQTTDTGPKVKILVAAQDLPLSTALDPDRHLKELDVSADPKMAEFRNRTYSPDLKATLRGQRINRFIHSGEPIFQTDVAASSDLSIAPGYRAMAIAVRGPNALSGVLSPGDFVKLMVTRPAGRIGGVGGGAGSSNAGMIWESAPIINTPLRVLAVGSRVRRPITWAEQYETTATGDASSVTLEVTEQQAAMILSETGAGQLAVTLILVPRNPDGGAPTAPPAMPAVSTQPVGTN